MNLKEITFNEEFPGGIGIGLTLPGGYINGATTESVSKILTKVEEDEIFEEFLDEYFTTLEEVIDMSETKQQSIQHFIEYASKRLNLKETPKINLMTGNDFGNKKSSLGGYNPETKEIVVATEGRLTADILRTIAHEMVHRKQDELGFITNTEKDGADGSPIENQAHAVAGILMREYGRINKQIYNEGIISGGKSEGKTLQDIADKHNTDIEHIKTELQKGIKVEMEHTTNIRMAAEIARDHIWEDFNYYEKLTKANLEERLLTEGGAAGHLAHPFEDEDLTFNDMREMINRGLLVDWIKKLLLVKN